MCGRFKHAFFVFRVAVITYTTRPRVWSLFGTEPGVCGAGRYRRGHVGGDVRLLFTISALVLGLRHGPEYHGRFIACVPRSTERMRTGGGGCGEVTLQDSLRKLDFLGLKMVTSPMCILIYIYIYIPGSSRIIQWVSNRLPYPTYRSPLGTRWKCYICITIILYIYIYYYIMYRRYMFLFD